VKRLFVAIATVLCLAAPAAAQADFTASAIMLTMMSMNQPGPQPQADPCTDCARTRKVALLSAVGNTAAFEGWGKNGTLDLTAWNVDGKITALIQKYLTGRFEFVDAAFDAKALAAAIGRDSRLKAYLKTVPNPGVDAYIVVRPISNAPGPGGIYLNHLGDNNVQVSANYEIEIYDAISLKRLAGADARDMLHGNHGFFPYADLDGISKPAVIAGTDPEALERIRRTVDWLLPHSVVETLRALELGASLPPAGDHSIAEPPLAAEMATFKTVGVVSVLGEDLRVVVGGHMFIARKNVAAPGAFPGLDADIEKRAGDVLTRNHTVKPVTLDRAALANVSLPVDGKMAPIPGLPTSTEVDAYVLFVKAPAFDDEANQGGVLLLHWIPAGNSSLAGRLQPRTQFLCEPTQPATQGMGRCPLDEKIFVPAVLNAPGEAILAEVRDKLAKILGSAVPETLFKVGLDSPAPQAAGTP
jgi:hypothetical protein